MLHKSVHRCSPSVGIARSLVTCMLALAVLNAQQALAGIQYTKMIVFGDSLSDTGNVLKNTTGAAVSQRPNEPYYDNGRWTNGSALNGKAELNLANTNFSGVWHERLAKKLGIPSPAKATLQVDGGMNYAYGGAVTSNTSGTYTNNIGYQVNTQYLGNTPAFSSTTLYAIWGGGNDIRDAANSLLWTETKVRTAGTTAATNLEKYIKAIATAAPNGTKVNVVWPNVPPMQLIPDFATASAAKKTALDLASKDFKAEQAAAAARLRGMFANLNLRLVDVHQYFTDVVAGRVFDLAGLNVSTPILDFNSFSGLGFSPTKNAAVPNGADPDSYIFWDKVHPTARFHDLIGELAQNAIPTPGVVVLVGVATVFAGQRRRRAA